MADDLIIWAPWFERPRGDAPARSGIAKHRPEPKPKLFAEAKCICANAGEPVNGVLAISPSCEVHRVFQLYGRKPDPGPVDRGREVSRNQPRIARMEGTDLW